MSQLVIKDVSVFPHPATFQRVFRGLHQQFSIVFFHGSILSFQG